MNTIEFEMREFNTGAITGPTHVKGTRNSTSHVSKESGQFPDPPSVKFAGDSRRWVHSRTSVLQVPTNKEDPVKSADPRGQKDEEKKTLHTQRRDETFRRASHIQVTAIV